MSRNLFFPWKCPSGDILTDFSVFVTISFENVAYNRRSNAADDVYGVNSYYNERRISTFDTDGGPRRPERRGIPSMGVTKSYFSVRMSHEGQSDGKSRFGDTVLAETAQSWWWQRPTNRGGGRDRPIVLLAETDQHHVPQHVP